MCLLLGATGVGKSLLVKRLQKLSSRDGKGDLGDPPPTRPTVGTNLTDIVAQKKITIRELGGCMGPIWSSYYGNCHSLLFMVDASNPTQLSASCVQLLGLLSAEELAKASVLILFNKIASRKHRCFLAAPPHPLLSLPCLSQNPIVRRMPALNERCAARPNCHVMGGESWLLQPASTWPPHARAGATHHAETHPRE
ncbi:ADP-ribosylation factor-like protein 16 isoform X4 [Bos taurus]|uniref:ADP-ribosylation factor-like protein 16 isoform X4 n=1 Tax=Bos taurus TaxID=9913 RepID=UPI0028CBBE44|nr:ADP-ribosylation factor-like protein 16 isoform X4 [Bos taurus]